MRAECLHARINRFFVVFNLSFYSICIFLQHLQFHSERKAEIVFGL